MELETQRLREKLRAQIEYTKIEYGGCGSLQWTIDKWGRITHKHGCPERRDPWCQTHPDGCPEPLPESRGTPMSAAPQNPFDEVGDLGEVIDADAYAELFDENAELREENKRLRSALRGIVGEHWYRGSAVYSLEMIDAGRAALAPSGESGSETK